MAEVWLTPRGKREYNRLYQMITRATPEGRDQLQAYDRRRNRTGARKAYKMAKEHTPIGIAAKKARFANSRSRQWGLSGVLSRYDVLALVESQNGQCWYCENACRESYVIDHCFPFSRGGSNTLANVVVACMTCNNTKHTLTAEEFILSLAK